jgi:CheY-like chemotaxis protein
VGNAVKFTEEGQVVVRLGLVDQHATEVRVRFEVVDTGIGIAAADQARLFQSFSQLDGSASRSFGGTGLGLAISKQIVELMGGEVGVESEEGRGSSFWFTARFEKASGTSKAVRSHPVLERQKVLVAADSGTGRRVLERQLAAGGVETHGARDGAEALRLLRGASEKGRPFAVALLDREAPGTDALELARAIRGEPALVATRLVLISALGRRGEAAEAGQAGFAGYLTRPVRTSDLLGCLQALMRAPASRPRPLVTRHSLAQERESGAPAPPPVAPAPLRILLAEDNPVNQMVALETLRHLGHRADLAENGHEALAALERRAYDVVLLDVQMPELDGLATARRIRRRWPRGSGPRLVAMTANVMNGDREECLAAGMDDYLGKPVHPATLEAALAQCVPGPGAGSGPADPAPPTSPDGIPGPGQGVPVGPVRDGPSEDVREG